MHLKLSERRKIMYENFQEVEGKIAYAEHLDTDEVDEI